MLTGCSKRVRNPKCMEWRYVNFAIHFAYSYRSTLQDQGQFFSSKETRPLMRTFWELLNTKCTNTSKRQSLSKFFLLHWQINSKSNLKTNYKKQHGTSTPKSNAGNHASISPSLRNIKVIPILELEQLMYIPAWGGRKYRIQSEANIYEQYTYIKAVECTS